MPRIFVTVKREGETRVRDLEVPGDIEARRLARLIAATLHWESDAAGQPLEYQIEAHPPGRVLAAGESLEAAGVGDGAWLVLQRIHSDEMGGLGTASATPLAPSVGPPAPSPDKRPRRGNWKRLD